MEVAQVDDAVRRFEEITGRRPRILIAKMGQDGHDRCDVCVARGGALEVQLALNEKQIVYICLVMHPTSHFESPCMLLLQLKPCVCH